jgi:hypothetical protein
MSDTPHSISSQRKSWNKPVLRAVIPTRRTAGGAFGAQGQDNAFYNVS